MTAEHADAPDGRPGAGTGANGDDLLHGLEVDDRRPERPVLLDADGRWLNHREIAIDGPVLHRDAADPNKLHLYLLSYQRHCLIGHFVLQTDEKK